MTPDVAFVRFRRLLGCAGLALLFFSRRLWTIPEEFPQIPFAAFLRHVPAWVDAGLLTLLCGALVALVIGPGNSRFTRWSCVAAGTTWAGLVALDQHRLQPWTWLFLLQLGVLILAPAAGGLGPLRMLIVSVYAWSGISKIDPLFVESHGRMLLDGLLGSVGLSDRLWSDEARALAIWTMPAWELLTAALLATPRLRRFGLVASLMMHAGLLLAVGPLGLQHGPGVLLWNVYFILQNLLLFRGESPSSVGASDLAGSNLWSRRLAWALVATAAVLPALESRGWWDHWPSWSVYSSRPAIVRVWVEVAAVEQLPKSLQAFAAPPGPLETSREVNLDRWSYAEVNSPPYPQARWKLAVAAAVAEKVELGQNIRVRIESRRDWWSGERQSVDLRGTGAVRERLNAYWLNTRPRVSVR